jgi:HD superfamily phosphohydrolase
MHEVERVRDPRPHSVLDSVHGLIRLTDREFSIVRHPLFQRLRKIKQNGLLYLVFPSATHTRFEHSLGALFVADAMVAALGTNSAIARRKGALPPFDTGEPEVAVDFSEFMGAGRSWLMRIVRLAALAHDLGHGPLSHTFDSFAPRREQVRELLGSGVIGTLSSLKDELADWGKKGLPGSISHDRVPHEVMSCVFFAVAWEAAFPGREPETVTEVAASILGNESLINQVEHSERRAWIRLIHDIVASAPADADRMDYLERDSKSIGVTYGLFDRNRVLKSLLCYRANGTARSEYRLGIKQSGIPALENLVQARYELFVQVYLHKTNRAVSRMLEELAQSAQAEAYELFDFDFGNGQESLDRLVDTYVELGDDRFLRISRGLEASVPRPPAGVREIANAVEHREFWKRVYEGTESMTERVAEALLSRVDATIAEGIIVDVSRPGATKDLAAGARILSRRADGMYALRTEQDWSDSSVIVRALESAEGNIGRVYARGAAIARLADLKAWAREIDAAPLARTPVN